MHDSGLSMDSRIGSRVSNVFRLLGFEREYVPGVYRSHVFRARAPYRSKETFGVVANIGAQCNSRAGWRAHTLALSEVDASHREGSPIIASDHP